MGTEVRDMSTKAGIETTSDYNKTRRYNYVHSLICWHAAQ